MGHGNSPRAAYGRLSVVVATSLLLISAPLSWAQQNFPKASDAKYINDLTGTMAASEICRLESSLFLLERLSGKKVAALIVPTTEPEDIEAFSNRVAADWNLGIPGSSNGILIVASKAEMQVAVRTGEKKGSGTEDSISSLVMNTVKNIIYPDLRRGDLTGALKDGINAIVHSAGSDVPSSRPGSSSVTRSLNGASFLVLLLSCLAGLMTRKPLGHLLAGCLCSGVSFLVVFLLASFSTALLLSGFVFVLIAFLETTPEAHYCIKTARSAPRSSHDGDVTYGGVSRRW